jgi:hypothetical protein
VKKKRAGAKRELRAADRHVESHYRPEAGRKDQEAMKLDYRTTEALLYVARDRSKRSVESSANDRRHPRHLPRHPESPADPGAARAAHHLP